MSIKTTRLVSWISSARKDFKGFPAGAQEIILSVLTIAAEGRKADIAKPMKGLGSGVFEVALPYRGNAFRVVMSCRLGMKFGSSMLSRRNRLPESKRRSMKSIL
jgi:phage-related protein